jgi:uncharacterized protein YdhG (YjbR/CyaY superfamily)
MQSNAQNPDQYIAELPEDRKAAMSKIREVILKNIPEGFEEQMSYGMLGYVVPHTLYPAGYHCTPKLPLPFLAIASQKNFISMYHMDLYAEGELLKWFLEEFAKTGYKLDMGKCCVRFKNMSKIPYDLIEELVSKVTVNQWIETYEKLYKSK